MNIEELLQLTVERGASDLHLKVPSPPVLRIDGALMPLASGRGSTVNWGWIWLTAFQG